ncbi:hypothetical protein ACFWN1_12535 [Streptomyces sp. NPDC058459]|uniref:hypothetical protein n=1 Tax=Streptomyces sp. NPDC058459 TaxID=3346508 RepID=UPI003662466F
MNGKPMTPEQRAQIAALLGDAKPATPGLLASFAQTVRDRREHDHTTQREDWYCLNLSAYMGERMATVLRRLLDAESRAERYRTAWGMARTRALSAGGAADRYAKRARQGQDALQDMLLTVIVAQMDCRAARLEADELQMHVTSDELAYERLRVALESAKRGRRKARAQVAEMQSAPLTVYRADWSAFRLGTYTSAAAARKHCETHVKREIPGATLDWIEDDGVAELTAAFGEDERSTGYTVTAVEVASEYDEEADE